MAELVCRNLSVGYDGKAVAENIDLTIEKGDYLFVVGENGAGKSTFMKTLLGLLKPVSGNVVFDGVKQKEIGYVPQQTSAQKDFPASVYEIVLSGCLSGCGFRPFYSKAQKDFARKNMELLGISDLAKKCYRELSGGQQQRVLLARALCAADKMLLLDEPVAGLDPIATQDLYDIVRKLNEENGMTIIMISHDISAALKNAKHVLYVGKPCYYATADEFKHSEFCKNAIED
ncbi:MAG TPA: ABC transporter [Clostridiales bacterium]|nr:ABC transporter [Clostridiales bacterium]HCH92867.1 ABC transporter [Clostridiales bacterium]